MRLCRAEPLFTCTATATFQHKAHFAWYITSIMRRARKQDMAASGGKASKRKKQKKRTGITLPWALMKRVWPSQGKYNFLLTAFNYFTCPGFYFQICLLAISLREASILSCDWAGRTTRRFLRRLPPHLNPLTQCLCSTLDEKSHEGRTHKGTRGRRGRALVGWIKLMCLSAFLGEFARPFAPRAAFRSEKLKN